MFNDTTKKTFLFRCNDCKTVLSVDFEEEDTIQKVLEDKFILECPCGSNSYVLRD